MKNFKSLLLMLGILAITGFSNAQSIKNVVNTAKKATKVSKNGTADKLGTVQQEGKTIHIEGMGQNKNITMNGGILHVEGAENRITVKGFADQVIIEGANTTVTIDAVNSVKIEGADTHVYYKTSNNKSGKATVSVFGTGSGVSKVK